MQNRYTGDSKYRYGFQGQEQDNEIKGQGNSVNYKYRMHDTRIGRFFATDPLEPNYPWYTPYQFSGNKVISHFELEGLEEFYAADGSKLGNIGTSTEKRVVNDAKIWTDYSSAKGNFVTNYSTNVGENLSRLQSVIDSKNTLMDNSTKIYQESEKEMIFKDWGEIYKPKSQRQEYGMMIFSQTFTNENGESFTGLVAGTTVTSGNKSELRNPFESSLVIGGKKLVYQFLREDLMTERVNVGGWNRFSLIHTHPSFDETSSSYKRIERITG